MTVEPLFKNYKKTIHLFIDIRIRSCTNAGLKKLSQVVSEQTSDSPAFLNAVCILKYVLRCEQHFSFFIFRSGLPVRVYCNWDTKQMTVKLSVPCLIHHHDAKVGEYRGMALCIDNLGTRWGRIVSFTPRPLYLHWRNTPPPPPVQIVWAVETVWKEKRNILLIVEIRTQIPWTSSR
jgi:hypothetical protein